MTTWGPMTPRRVGGRARRLVSAGAALMLAAGLIVALGPAQATAEPPGGDLVAGITVAPNPAAANVSPEMLAAMRRDLKVTVDQARARLVRADWATRLDEPLRRRLGRAYAGSWLAKDGQEFVVAVTDRSLERVVRASGATPRLVAHSQADLSAIGGRLEQRVKAAGKMPDGVAGWVLDPERNRVTVQVRPGGHKAAAAFVAGAGVRADQVAYEVDTQRAIPFIEGGEEYRLSSGGRCSTAFSVTNDLGNGAFLTAAHCFRDETPDAYLRIYTVPPRDVHIGYLRRTVTGPEHDEAVVTLDTPLVAVPRVSGHGSPDIPVTDGVEQVGGSPACMSAARSGLVCGTIRPGEFTTTLNGRLIQRYHATDTCGGPGDSGGAVISGTHGQGIVSGGPFPCPWFAFRRFTYYVPLQRALSASGSVLRTTTVPSTPTTPPSPNKAWTTGGTFWNGLGGAVQGRVGSVSLGANSLQVFGRGTDNRLWTNLLSGNAWSGWQSLGAADALTGPPTVLARAGGIDVYYRGVDTRPYLRRWNGTTWEPPLKLGEADVEGTITAISPQPGHVILFIRGSDDEVYYNFTDGVAPWSGWLGLGGDVNAPPTAIARTNAAGQIVLEVYARWADDNVRYRRLDPAGPPGWQPWVNLGGIWKDTPAAVTVGPDHSWLIGWARDDTVHVQRWKDGGWLRGPDGSINTGWRGIGGNVQSTPTAIAGPEEQVRVFARDANQRINTITWAGGDIQNWQGWVPLDGDTAQPVALNPRTSDMGSLIDAFGIDVATQQPFHTQITAAPPVQLEVNDSAATVGDPVSYRVTGPPGAPISWTSTKDGVPTGEDHASYGQRLDGNGEFTWAAGTWPGSAVGSWVKQVHVGSQTPQTAQVAFTVSPRPVTIEIDKAAYQVGENITYAVTGPAGQEIRWSSTVNGQPTGESNASYGHQIGPEGVFTLTVPWTEALQGTWTKQVNVGGQTAQVSFDVTVPPSSPGLQAQPMAAATSGDNRMYLVAQGQDQRIWVTDQTTAGGPGWSNWYPLGTEVFIVPPTAVVNPQGKVEVYAVGTDQAVYRNVQTGSGSGGWTGWSLIGSCCIISKVSVSWDRYDRLNVFGLGTNNSLYITRQLSAGSTSWTGWAGMGGYLSRPPVAVGFWYRTVHYHWVFGIGGDSNVYSQAITDTDPNTRTFGGWEATGGGPVTGDLTGVVNHDGGLADIVPVGVFARRPDNKVHYYNPWNGQWQSIGEGTLTSDPIAMAGRFSGDFAVLSLGSDGRANYNRQTCTYYLCMAPAWSGWYPLGPDRLLTSPAGAVATDGLGQAFGLDPDGRVLLNKQSTNGANGWMGWSLKPGNGVAATCTQIWPAGTTFWSAGPYAGCNGYRLSFPAGIPSILVAWQG